LEIGLSVVTISQISQKRFAGLYKVALGGKVSCCKNLVRYPMYRRPAEHIDPMPAHDPELTPRGLKLLHCNGGSKSLLVTESSPRRLPGLDERVLMERAGPKLALSYSAT
jgi:hypothetical protein